MQVVGCRLPVVGWKQPTNAICARRGTNPPSGLAGQIGGAGWPLGRPTWWWCSLICLHRRTPPSVRPPVRWHPPAPRGHSATSAAPTPAPPVPDDDPAATAAMLARGGIRHAVELARIAAERGCEVRAEDLQVVPELEVILEWLKADKRCPSIRRTNRRAKGWRTVVTPNRSTFWMALENDSRTQELQIRVYDKVGVNLNACSLSDQRIFDWLAKTLGLPLDPPAPADAPNPDGGE